MINLFQLITFIRMFNFLASLSDESVPERSKTNTRSHMTTTLRYMTVLALCFIVHATLRASSTVEITIRGGSTWAESVVRDQVKTYNADKTRLLVRASSWNDERNFEKFIKGTWNCEVLFHRVLPTDEKANILKTKWPEGVMQPESFIVGHVRVAVIVHRANRIDHITLDQLHELLKVDKTITTWRDMGIQGSDIVPYGEDLKSTSRWIVRRACMMLGPEKPRTYYNYRNDFEKLPSADEVINRIRRDPQGIGFILYDGKPLPANLGVRFVPVAASDDEDPVALKQGSFIQDDYPLAEPLVLYLRPDASNAARKFCKFAISPEGQKIAAKHGLTTPSMHAESVASERLNQVAAGEGERVRAVGVDAIKQIIPELSDQYIRSKDVMQFNFRDADQDTSLIGAFVSKRASKTDLLFLMDRPSDRAMDLFGKKWNQLQPPEHVLAGRATAIIVNAANKLDSLTLGQIESIFAGQVDDWSVVAPGSIEVQAEREGANDIPIKRYGLRSNDAAARAFHKDRMDADQHGRIKLLPTTADVVSAVSIDPQAIGFVDLAAIPESGQTIKVLGIQLRSGNTTETIYPKPETIRNAMYPYAERLYLYVHPDANETAKCFAEFLSSGGRSAKTPYTEPVKYLMKLYQSYGLTPLSKAAIEQPFRESP